MNQTARIISIYAADTSGVCSALYEFGGMTVIHDASGCNSTYTTHDEPRWYDMDSMMYISGLTENDAVMGNDEKFISDLARAAEELKPEYVAICASPMPAMIGIDMDAIAYEVESRTGIPSFDVKTNGMQSYITGAGNAFLKLAERFTEAPDKKNSHGKIKVNILGMTPLDFPIGTDREIREWLESVGFEVNSCIGMGCSLADVKRLGDGDVSLVVSSVGRPLAEWLKDRFDIPFVVGVPYGNKFSSVLAENLRKVRGVETDDAEELTDSVSGQYRIYDSRIAVVGESVLSTSLAAAISLEYGLGTRVLETVGEGDMSQLSPSDYSCDDEDELEKELSKAEIIIGDPLFEPICRGKKFIRLPHDAFSGRCFHREAKKLIETPDYLAHDLISQE
ncbi:MAG: oxidoreductase [Eubacterium sp.]|nr:oxidoreductase [Eubacterium sp.]